MKKQDFHKIKVKIITNNFDQVFGIITVPINGYRSRLSDLLNNSQEFIALTEVEIYHEQKLIDKTDFLCMNKHSIMFLSEADVITPLTVQEAEKPLTQEITTENIVQ